MREDQIQIDYDDQLWEVIEKVNEALLKHNLAFIDDSLEHDAFCIYSLEEIED